MTRFSVSGAYFGIPRGMALIREKALIRKRALICFLRNSRMGRK